MKQLAKNNILHEKIIFALIIIAGALIVYNQFQFTALSSNTLLNAITFLLILVLIGCIVWLIVEVKLKQYVNVNAEKSKKVRVPLNFYEKVSFALLLFVAALVMFNQVQISGVNALVGGKPTTGFASSISSNILGGNAVKEGVIIGPRINTDGRTTSLVDWPTISGMPKPKKTGNAQQDAITTVVPTGTPFYALGGPGSEKIKGVSFDDPLSSQKVWASLLGSRRFGTANAIELTPEEEGRWNRLVGLFTCDYCCGGPNSVTTISRCGCAHSYAWQGMAKFFIKNYPQYTNDQILGEMTKWKAIWYPKGMIQDYLVFTGQASADILTHGGSAGIRQQFSLSGAQHSQPSSLDELPSMVGGC